MEQLFKDLLTKNERSKAELKKAMKAARKSGLNVDSLNWGIDIFTLFINDIIKLKKQWQKEQKEQKNTR